MNRRRLLNIAAVLMLLAASTRSLSSAMSQPVSDMRIEGGSIDFHVVHARPLAVAIIELEKACKCVITYEDPRLVHEEDLVDSTVVPVHGRRFIVPRGGELNFTYRSPSNELDEIGPILRELVRQYDAADLPGRFSVLEDEGVFHVVPRAARDRDGRLQPVDSVLSPRVNLPQGERPIAGAIDIVLSGVAEQAQHRISFGMTPRRFATTPTRVGGTQETARSVLRRILNSADASLSWQLMYDPSFAMYVLNVHRVEQMPGQ